MRERDVSGTFEIARNPDGDSRLGYLVRLPADSGDVVLKAADTWPRTKALYCHPGEWPDAAQIIEAVPVRTCRRRGVAIDLVLERPRENRAQFVFTTARGRDVIFWQSPRTTARARPGVRVPHPACVGARDAHHLGRHPGALPLPLRPPTSCHRAASAARRLRRRAR